MRASSKATAALLRSVTRDDKDPFEDFDAEEDCDELYLRGYCT